MTASILPKQSTRQRGGARGSVAAQHGKIVLRGPVVEIVTVTDLDDLPTVGLHRALDAAVIGAVHDRLVGDAVTVEALAVEVHDPGKISELTLGEIGNRLIQRAFAELGVADDGPEMGVRHLVPVLFGELVGEAQISRLDRGDSHGSRREKIVVIGIIGRMIRLKAEFALGGECAQIVHGALRFGR